MKTIGKGIVIFLVLLGLVGCGQRSRYESLFYHPDQLQPDLSDCRSGKLPANSQICEDALVVSEVLSDYQSLEIAQGKPFRELQQLLADTQEKLNAAGGNTALRDQILAEQEQAIMPYNQVYFSVQENFAKLIMASEATLADLKESRQQLESARPVDRDQLARLDAEIRHTESLIQAMLVLVGLNSGG